MTDDVLLDQRGNVLIVCINRPQARNAVNRAVSEAMAAAMDRLDSSQDIAVAVITGAAGTFCAGMDLKAYLTGEQVSLADRGFAGLCQRPPLKPVIAAVEGWALAGGFEIALACDLIVAARDAQFGLPEVKRGLVAGAGGLVRLPRKLSANAAMHLALTGDPIDASEAHRLGLVTVLTEPAGALDEAVRVAKRIAANGPSAVATTKQIMTASPGWSPDQIWTEQERLIRPVFDSAEAREGARAFAEKRPPNWRTINTSTDPSIGV